jgi:hypothetical protein
MDLKKITAVSPVPNVHSRFVMPVVVLDFQKLLPWYIAFAHTVAEACHSATDALPSKARRRVSCALCASCHAAILGSAC